MASQPMRLRLAIVLGPEHAQHQQRHGADDQHDLRRDQPIARDQPAHGVRSSDVGHHTVRRGSMHCAYRPLMAEAARMAVS